MGNIGFVNNRLLEAEIVLFNRLKGVNVSSPFYQDRIRGVTAGFSKMVGKIILNKGSVTGTLIPLPSRGGTYEWAVLTCGHIINCIDRADNPNEEARFELSGIPPISIRSIKVFKKNSRKACVVNKRVDRIDPSPWNTIELASLASFLPRYDLEGDVAICYLSDATGPFDTQRLLRIAYPITSFRHERNKISFNIDDKSIAFNVVGNREEVDEIVRKIGSEPRDGNLILGYASFDAVNNQILSGTRSADAIYHTNIYDKFIGNYTSYDFVHDAPTYPGMSGGPIFHFAPSIPGISRATISVYGVVQSSDFSNYNPPCCFGSFLQRSLLE